MKKTVVLLAPALLIYLFSPSYGLQAASGFFALFILCGFFSSRLTARGLVVRRARSVLRVHRGQDVEVELYIENRSIFSLEYLFVSDDYGPLFGGEESSSLMALKPGESHLMRYTVTARERGLYTLGPVLVRGADSFGFFPWVRKIEERAELVVYPALHKIDALVETGLVAGSLHIDNPLYEDLSMYRFVREYVRGDDLRRLHWKVSARTGVLHTREYDSSFYFSVLVILNLSVSGYGLKYRKARIERCIEAAAALALYCLNRGQNVGLLCDGQDREDAAGLAIQPGEGHGHVMHILEALARVAPVPDNWQYLVGPAINPPYNTRVFYVGPPLIDKELHEFLDRWRPGRSVDVFHVLSDAVDYSGFAQTLQNAGCRVHALNDFGGQMLHE